MNMVLQSAFLKALGWSLLDSMWQMGTLWIIYLVLTANGQRFQSSRRHLLALLSLAGGMLWFVLNLCFRFYKAVDNESAGSVAVSDAGSPGVLNAIQEFFEPCLPYFSIVYLGITIMLFFRLYRQYRDTRSLFTSNISKADPELRIFVQQLAFRMGIKKDVRILLSKLIDTPMTLGFWKPVILIPVAAINQLSIKQTEAIILHELHHIQRNDYLINLLIASTETLLFFNPFIKIFSDIIRKERENCCDDLVIQFKYDPANYAQALLKLELNRSVANPLAIAATGKNKQLLLNRVKRILTNETVKTPVNQRLIACFIGVLIIAAIGWYNPGKMIVKTVEAVNQNIFAPAQLSETPQRFATPGEALASTAPVVSEKNIRSTPKHRHETDPQNDLITELVADAVIDEISSAETDEALEPFLSFVGQEQERDFSIPETKNTVPPPSFKDEHPYVPSNSFSFQFMEDTAMPKKYIITPGEQKAKESLEKALKALEELNWAKLEKEMNSAGKKVDIVKLQDEIRKAMSEVDWKKINEEVQAGLTEATEEIFREHENLRTQLQSYQKDRNIRQQKAKKTHEIILQDRLNSSQAPKARVRPQTDSLPKKKIVII
jgi:beta-lactamase regulating signal transducer with metallopeptidase domain